MPSKVVSWFANPWIDGALMAFSVLAIALSIWLVPRFLAKLPPDYLQRGAEPHASVVLRVLRNVLGVILVLLGIAMLVLPGQGILTLIVGLMLVDLPGKHQLVVRLLAQPKVLSVVNKLRAHHHAPPLVPADRATT